MIKNHMYTKSPFLKKKKKKTKNKSGPRPPKPPEKLLLKTVAWFDEGGNGTWVVLLILSQQCWSPLSVHNQFLLVLAWCRFVNPLVFRSSVCCIRKLGRF